MDSLFEILVVGLVLSVDSFSAALALGARPHQWRDTLKFAFSSGGAEALVSLLGAMAGAKIVAQFDAVDHWISFLLLTLVALHMAYEGMVELRDSGKNEPTTQPFHSFLKILLVSFATSLDAFAVGVSLGVSEKPLAPYISSIGLWAFFSTIFGMNMAKMASKKMGPVFNLLGAFVLFALACKFLSEGFHHPLF